MPSTPVSSLHRNSAAVTSDLQTEYGYLRDKLERLMAEAVKDFPAIDQLVDQLESIQLQIKGEHGMKGNNPNE